MQDTFYMSITENPALVIGQVAQVVEQRPEKPCVGGSNPSLTTYILQNFDTAEPLLPSSDRLEEVFSCLRLGMRGSRR